MGLLEGKKLVVTGVLTDCLDRVHRRPAGPGAGGRDRAHQLRPAHEPHPAGGQAAADHARRARARRQQPRARPVLTEELDRRWGRLDGMVHSIGFAPESCLGGNFMTAPWDDVATAVQVSAYSLRVLADVAVPLMAKAGGGSIVGLDFDNSTPGLPGVRLDGRRQGGAGGDVALPGPRPRAPGASG